MANARGPTGRAPEETTPRHGDTQGDPLGEDAGLTSVPPYLLEPLAGLEGKVLLESGGFRQALRISESYHVDESLARISHTGKRRPQKAGLRL